MVAKNEKDLALATMVSLAQKDVAAPIDEKTINLIPPRIQGLYDQADKASEIGLSLKIRPIRTLSSTSVMIIKP